MRNTRQRTAVLDAVRRGGHPTAERVCDRVKAALPAMSRGTVYRNLAVLEEMSELRIVRIPGAGSVFDFNTEPHEHAVCVKCGKIWDIYPRIDLADGLDGARVVSSEFTMRCVCADCIEKGE